MSDSKEALEEFRKQIAWIRRIAAERQGGQGGLPVQSSPTPSKLVVQPTLEEAVPETLIPGYWESVEENAGTWAEELTVQPFWKSANLKLHEWTSEYALNKSAALLSQPNLGTFAGKGLPRLKEKALRDFAKSPLETFPPGAPPVPRINDLVRARVATRYLDGVTFLADKLRTHLRAEGLKPVVAIRNTGYYAVHIHFEYTRSFKFNEEEMACVTCEIQVATELSTTIWDRTHSTYEFARETDASDQSWHWEHEDPRFLAAQLANMIHLADGLVMRLREASGGRRRSKP